MMVIKKNGRHSGIVYNYQLVDLATKKVVAVSKDREELDYLLKESVGISSVK